MNIAISRYLLAEAASGAGSVSSATPILGRGFSGGVGASVTAPAVTMAAMGLQELFFGADFAYSDYLAKAARTVPSAFVAGAGGSVAAGLITGGGTAAAAGGGGALAAGGGGAIGGSWAPLIGTAIGFVVGVGIYLIADEIWGEEIEEEVKLALGQGGCPRPEPTEPIDYPPDYMMF